MSFSPLDSTLHGDLFVTPAMRAAFGDRARVAAMLEAERALAKAQARLGMVPERLASDLASLDPDGLDMEAIGRGTPQGGVPVIPFVKMVGAALPGEAEPFFHRGTTSQDVADTALVLQMREAFALLEADLAATVAGLSRLARAHRDLPCAGRTTAQHAAVVTFGYKVAVWCDGVAEAWARLPDVRARALAAQLGGPVGTLSVFGERGPELLESFAAELGLAAPTIAWHTQRARMMETGAWLGLLIGALAKLATDAVHLSSTEVGEIAEPGIPGRGGSSAMPHKRNPLSATMILAAHTVACGHVSTLMSAVAAAHERPHGAWHAEWHALPALFGLASGALREARRLAEGMEVHEDRVRANVDLTRGLLFTEAASTALADRVGRDTAHRLVRQAADRVQREGCDLRAALEREPELDGVVSAGLLDRVFDLGPAIASAGIWVDRVTSRAEHLERRHRANGTEAP